MPDSPMMRVYPGEPSVFQPMSEEEDESQWRAAERAIRFAGQLEYKQLVEGGAKPEEALRRTAHKLFFNSPQHLSAALERTAPLPSVPSEINLVPMRNPQTGETMGYGYMTSSGSISPLSTGRGEIAAQQHIIDQENRQRMSELGQVRRQLSGGSLGLPPAPEEASALSNRLAQLEGDIATGRSNYVALSRGGIERPKAKEGKPITRDVIDQFMRQALGKNANPTPEELSSARARARKLAREAGYSL